MSRKEVNFKSKLIEWSQKNKMEVSFELIEQSLDKENNPVFQTEVRIEGITRWIRKQDTLKKNPNRMQHR